MLSAKNSLFIKNTTGLLQSNNYLNNELYRIGGFKSIRGFSEKSIFTSQYSYFNIEYRYLTSSNSYLYSITDFGKFKNYTSNTIYGIGIGYLFKIKKSQINIGYVLGNGINNLKNTKILFQILNYF